MQRNCVSGEEGDNPAMSRALYNESTSRSRKRLSLAPEFRYYAEESQRVGVYASTRTVQKREGDEKYGPMNACRKEGASRMVNLPDTLLLSPSLFSLRKW